MQITGNVRFGSSIEMKVAIIENLVDELERQNLEKTR